MEARLTARQRDPLSTELVSVEARLTATPARQRDPLSTELVSVEARLTAAIRRRATESS